jgi:adenylate kinase family enzyme
MNLAKIIVIGSSCSGKTTFAKRLAQQKNAKFVELDALFWQPYWVKTGDEEFKAKVVAALQQDSWIADGDYRRNLMDVMWPQADAIVWLNPPFYKILYRFFMRTARRSWKREVLWNGCQETVKNALFQRDSLLFYILRTHRRRMANYTALMKSPPYPHLKFFRLKSARDVENFVRSLT